jgi:hypothetical protein
MGDVRSYRKRMLMLSREDEPLHIHVQDALRTPLGMAVIGRDPRLILVLSDTARCV